MKAKFQLTLTSVESQVMSIQPRKSDEISTVVGVFGYGQPCSLRAIRVVKRMVDLQEHQTNRFAIPADGSDRIVAPIPLFILFSQKTAGHLDLVLNKPGLMINGGFSFLLENRSKHNML